MNHIPLELNDLTGLFILAILNGAQVNRVRLNRYRILYTINIQGIYPVGFIDHENLTIEGTKQKLIGIKDYIIPIPKESIPWTDSKYHRNKRKQNQLRQRYLNHKNKRK